MNVRSLPFALATTGVLAAVLNPAQGRAADEIDTLYQEQCTACHGSEVYTRDDRKITSYDGLTRQVRRCELSLELGWFDEDVARVSDYLDQRFYHFKH